MHTYVGGAVGREVGGAVVRMLLCWTKGQLRRMTKRENEESEKESIVSFAVVFCLQGLAART